MKIIRHLTIILVIIFIILGIPVFRSGYLQKRQKDVDAVSSATVIIEQPSGEYVVLINSELHDDRDKLLTWEKFFKGEEIDFLFDDISCIVADIDSTGMDLARSFQSRLPENQMTIRTEDVTLMLSKAIYGKFDVILISGELADLYHAEYSIDESKVTIIEGGG